MQAKLIEISTEDHGAGLRHIFPTWLVVNTTPVRSVPGQIGGKTARAFLGGDAHFKTNRSMIHSVQIWCAGKNLMRNGSVPVFPSIESIEFAVFT